MENINPAFVHKVTIIVMDDDDFEDDVMTGFEWLEKWKGHYHVISDEGGNNEVILDVNVLCDEEAFKEAHDLISCNSPWTRGEVTIEELKAEEARLNAF